MATVAQLRGRLSPTAAVEIAIAALIVVVGIVETLSGEYSRVRARAARRGVRRPR